MPEKKKCFVVCPIGAEGSDVRRHADWLYEEIICHVLDTDFSGQFEVLRSDKIYTSGMIDAQIIKHLLEDDLVIADMSMLNANAFYELGIRHMAQKPIVHMFRSGETIPFDVKLYRAFEFDYVHPSHLAAARKNLRLTVDDAMKDDHVVDNPVTRARGTFKVEQGTLSETESLQAQIDEIRQMVSQSRNRWLGEGNRSGIIVSRLADGDDANITQSVEVDVTRLEPAAMNTLAGRINRNGRPMGVVMTLKSAAGETLNFEARGRRSAIGRLAAMTMGMPDVVAVRLSDPLPDVFS